MQSLHISKSPRLSRQPHAEVKTTTNNKDFKMNVAETIASISRGCAAESPDAEMSAENPNGKPPLSNYNVELALVSEFVPNDWNPNHMADEQAAAYAAEVRRTGTISKPIIARWVEGNREIVDGEQSWRAAISAGISEVPCVMLELDNFDAMRQTLIRNEHGKHDPLEDGLLCLRMMEERGLSRRRLADELPRGKKFGEATVRNKLKYVDAIALRKHCAVEKVRNYFARGDEDCRTIAGLSLKQVEAYLDLPDGFRDRWLESGADLKLLKQTFCFDDPPELVPTKQLLVRLSDCGLLDLIDLNHWESSMQRPGEFALWCGDHLRVANIEAYVRPVAELRLNIKLLACLPYKVDGNGNSRVGLSPEEWTQIVRRAKEQNNDRNGLQVCIANAVQAVLQQRGLDAAKMLTHEEVSQLADLEAAPDYISDADHLSIKEQHQLYRAHCYVAEEFQDEAKRMVVEEFARRRSDSDEPSEFEGRTVTELYRECARRLEREQRDVYEDEVLSDADCVKAQLLARLCGDEAIKYGTIRGRPAKEVLAEQLTEVAPSLLTMIGSVYLFPLSAMKPSTRWLQAAGGVIGLQSADSAASQQSPKEE